MNLQLIKECSDYLKQSEGNPLIRRLGNVGPDFRKIKVRKGKPTSKFDRLFNNVFMVHPDLRQRCIFANGLKRFNEVAGEEDVALDEYYIFPTNGFQYIYSLNVVNSASEYKETLEKFMSVMDEDQAIKTFSEVLKYDYESSNLLRGIQEGSEIILYGIPYYYAIRKSGVKSYSTLFSL